MSHCDMTGEHGSATRRPSRPVRASVFVLAALGFCSVAIAGKIVADPHAPGNHKPTVLETANGTPLVNIQTPSDAGVSRNTYKQFDVDKKGAILNNARKRTQTQLSGWVQGNPWLATGSAKVILNEVNSNDPSQLRGYLEVAGKKAEVVVANPAGITCDGCGFINANRATLTTGKPQMQDGALKGYRVDNGMIRVSGAGLDASQTDYTRLIARSVKANAGIWANNLEVTTGTNIVSRKTGQIQENKPGKDAPHYALDVGKLGGMYANEIFLVGTEKGVGVRNAGTIGARAGNLVVTANGRLENTGRLQSRQNVTINTTGGVANAGDISASREVAVHTPKDVDNAHGTIDARRVDIQAASLANRQGTIAQTGPRKLALNAGKISNRDGGRIGAPQTKAASDAEGPDQNGQKNNTQDNSSEQQAPQTSNTDETSATAGNDNDETPAPLADGQLAIENTLNNDAGTIAAGGTLSLQTDSGLNNDGGTLYLQRLTVGSGDVSNRGGTLHIAENVDMQANTVSNDKGLWQVVGRWALNAQRLSNRGGQMLHVGTAPTTFNITGTLDNSGGLLASNASRWILATGALTNENGEIRHTGDDGLDIQTGHLQGRGGKIVTPGKLNLTAATVDQRGAELTAAQVQIGADRLDNRQGRIIASGENANRIYIGQALDNSGGVLATNDDLHLQAAVFENKKGEVRQAGEGSLILDTPTLEGTGGTLESNGQLRITGQTINLSNGQTTARNLTIHTGKLTTAGGSLTALGKTPLVLHASRTLDNTGGQIQTNGVLDLATGELTNAGGKIVTAATSPSRIQASGHFDNSHGALMTGADTHIQAGSLDNTGGQLTVAGDHTLSLTVANALQNRGGGRIATDGTAHIKAKAFDNSKGSLQVRKALDLSIANAIDNDGGLLQARRLTVDAKSLSNQQGGTIEQTGRQKLALQAGRVSNRADGRIGLAPAAGAPSGEDQPRKDAPQIEADGPNDSVPSVTETDGADTPASGKPDNDNSNDNGGAAPAASLADGWLHIAGALDNDSGTIRAGGDITLQTRNGLDNDHGHLKTRQLTLENGDLNNHAGELIVAGDSHTSADTINNNGGEIQVDGDWILSATHLSNRDGSLRHAGTHATTFNITKTLDNTHGLLASNAAQWTLNADTFINENGTLKHAGQDALHLNIRTLDGANGAIATAGDLQLKADQVDHDRATLTARRASIFANDFDNHHGKIVLDGDKRNVFRIDHELNNNDGVIASNGDLTVHTQKLDNASGAIKQAGQGSLTLEVTTLVGQSGTLASNGDLQITGNNTQLQNAATTARRITIQTDHLNHTGATLVATGDDPLKLQVKNTLDNSAGTIHGNGNLTLTAGTLKNHQGAILIGGKKASRINIAKAFDNSQGKLVTAADTTLKADQLDNTGGALQVAENGTLNAIITQNLSNRDGGQITATGPAKLHMGALDNRKGTIYTDKELVLNANGNLLNDNGTLVATKNLQLAAQTLSNRDDGLLGSLKGDAKLTIGGRLDNTGGNIQSDNVLVIASGALANMHGNLLGGAVTLQTAKNPLDNTAGIIAATDGDIHIGSGALANTDGLIQAEGNIAIAAPALTNPHGLVSAGSKLAVSATRIDNHDTKDDTAAGLQGDTVQLHADSIGNKAGLIAADKQITLMGTGSNSLLDNRHGLISSAGDIKADLGHLSNTKGTLLSDGNQTLQLTSFDGNGKILAQGDLTLALTDDWYQTGTLKAGGQGKLTTRGTLVNKGNIYAGKLNLQAQTIDNTAEGTLNGGQTRVTAHDKLTNRGLIDGSATRIDAGTLDNIGTGRIYGDHLAIEADTLNNREENTNGQTKAATIAARERLDIGAGTINNREHALIFSAGSGDTALNIGGTLDAGGHATGQAHKIHNASATIESLGGLVIGADTLRNTNEHLKTDEVQVSGPIHFHLIKPDCDADWCHKKYDPNDPELNMYIDDRNRSRGQYFMTIDGHEVSYGAWTTYDFDRTEFETKIISSDPAEILSGGGMELSGGDFLNKNSHIIAGGALKSENLDELRNEQEPGEHRIHDIGTTDYRWIYSSGLFHKTHVGHDRGNYEPSDVLTTVDLGITQSLSHTHADDVGYKVAARRTGEIDKKAGGADKSQIIRKSKATPEGAATPEAAKGSDVAKTNQDTPDTVMAEKGQATPITGMQTVDAAQKAKGSTTPTAQTDKPDTVQATTVDTTFPEASLFQQAPAAKGYLIETDPAFTDYRSWLSSDYMLKQLQHDPNHIQKRLGDGYYEQRLLREQVAELTGQRYLDGYSGDTEEYKALMNAGVKFAKKYNLVPGVALTAKQMASLTDDIVWLESQPVTLPDGSTTTALVPQLYLRPGRAHVQPGGSLIAGNSIDINARGNINNSGTIAGRTDVNLSGSNLRNRYGHITGRNLQLTAKHDLDNIGGALQADHSLIATAGHDLNITTTTRSGAKQAGRSSFSHTNIDRVAKIDVTGDNGLLALSAGHDANFTAAALANTGPDSVTAIQAGNDIKLGTVTTHVQENLVYDADNYLKQGHRREHGTTIDTGGDIALQAGNNLKLRAATLDSDNGAIIADVGHNLRIENGENNDHWSSASKHTSSGFLSSTTTVTRDSQADTYAAASTLSGDSVALKAGQDLHITASNVVADNDVTAVAGHGLTIDAATNQHREQHYKKKTAHGLFTGGGASGLGGLGFTIGSQKAKATAELGEQTTAGSLIGSTQGNVTMAAGDDLTVVGSDVIAGRAKGATTGGDITLQGKNINITSATQTHHGKTTQHSSQHGLSMALVGTPLDGIRNVRDTRHEQAGSGKKAQDTAYAIGSALGDMPGLAVGYGSANASQSHEVEGTTQRGSSVRASGALTLNATDGALTVTGSNLSAGATATLAARNDINLLASADTQSQSGHSSSHQTSYVLAPVSGGDLDRHLHSGVNHSGVSLSPYNTGTSQGDKAEHISNETGTTLTADRINLASHSGDINANGAQLTATHDINLHAAQGNISLGTGTTRKTWHSRQDQHQFGDLGGNGYAATVGSQSREQATHGKQVAQSTLRTGLTSHQGDVNIIAHDNLTGQGVDISGRDVTLVGQNVSLLPSEDATAQTKHSHQSHLGITLAASGVAVQAAQAADSAIVAHDRGDNRLAALYAAEAAYGASDASQTAGSIDYSRAGQAASGHADKAGASPNGNTSLIKATVSIGGGHQSSRSATRSRTQQGSTITANRDINILATGDGTTDSEGYAANGDILMQGATLKADRNIDLTAARDIHLQSSQDSRKQDQHHSGSSASIGVGFSFGGEQNGFTLELAAAGNKGKAQGTGTTHHATEITAGHTLSLTSGRDTTLHGAQAKGKTIDAHIGRNLTLTSTQDNNHYTEKDQSGGVGLSLCIPPFCYGTSGGSASYSQNDIKNTYQSVTDQTGLAAGQGGFDIHVGGTTALTGAALASTADPSKNQLDTGNLTTASLHNIAISSANKTGASFNTSGSLGSNITQNAEGATLNLAIPQNGNQTSETESRIAQGTIRVRNHLGQDLTGINRDASTLDGNGVTNDFDLDQIKKNQELGQAAGYVGMRMAGDIAEYEQRQAVNDLIEAKSKNDKAAEAAAQAKLANWGDGGKYTTALHGMIGAATASLGGGDALQGALGATASEAASGVMQTYLNNHGIKPNSTTGNTLMNLASTAIGATAGQGNGAATALYGDKYNWLLHSEIQAADEKRNACKTQACRDNVIRATEALNTARDADLLAYGSKTQRSAYQQGWTKAEYNQALENYWAAKGIARSDVAIGAYAPSEDIGYQAREFWGGVKSSASQLPDRIGEAWNVTANFMKHPIEGVTDSAVATYHNVINTGQRVYDWSTSPIPAQTLQTQLDHASLKTPRQLGSDTVDMAVDVGTLYVGDGALRVVGTGAKAAARSEVGRATAKAGEAAWEKRGPVALGLCLGYSTACANVDKYVGDTSKFGLPSDYVEDQLSISAMRQGVKRKQYDDFRAFQLPNQE